MTIRRVTDDDRLTTSFPLAAYAFESSPLTAARTAEFRDYLPYNQGNRTLVADPLARALLLQFFARHVDQIQRITVQVPPDELPELWLTDLDVHVEARTAVPGSSAPMARLLSLDALSGLPAGPGRVRIELTGDRWLAGAHLLDGTTGALELVDDTTARTPTATLTAAGLSALAYGVLDPAELPLRGLGEVPVDAATELRGIFPRRVPYVFADF